jgi:hypothetical protein
MKKSNLLYTILGLVAVLLVIIITGIYLRKAGIIQEGFRQKRKQLKKNRATRPMRR